MSTTASARLFQLHVPDEVLADLRARLARVRWPDEPPGAPWSYGTSVDYLRGLIEYWRDGFDWRKQEAALNRFTQFKVPIAGIELHYIHQQGIGPAPRPLLLSHGWPGSVVEFHKIIPMLTDPASFGGDPADAFTVVAPSLPGYPLSFQPDQKRFGVVGIADIFATLMTDHLGYRRFAAQGGDWGASITSRLGHAYPDRLTGIHLNFLMVPRDRKLLPGATAEEQQYLREMDEWLKEEAGYQWIQGTRPQTLAFGLSDSPAGLAAWLIEKFRSWSDCAGNPENAFTKDELLTNITLYWVTGAIGSSFWPYYERRHSPPAFSPAKRIEVPTGYVEFPKEILRPPRSVAELSYNIQRWTKMDKGGHFAALEQPAALAEDIREFFRERR